MNTDESFNSSNGADDIADPMFDWLLHETLNQSRPPNLTDEILRRLSQSPVEFAPDRARPSFSASAPRRRSRGGWMLALTVVAGLLLVVGIGNSLRNQWRRPVAAMVEPIKRPANAPETVPTAVDPPNVPQKQQTDSVSRPLTGIELTQDLPGDKPSEATDPAIASSSNRPSVAKSLQPIQLVSRSIDNQWQVYWKRLGVDVQPQLGAQDRMDMVSQTLGVTISSEAIDDADLLQTILLASESSEVIARQLLAAMVRQSPKSLDEKACSSLSQTLSSGRGLDRWIADVVADGRWAKWLQPHSDHERTVITAGLLAGKDLRCARCHDLDGGDQLPLQAEYWQFAAFVQPLTAATRSKSLFYDLADGRRKLAEPVFPGPWRRPNDVALDDGIQRYVTQLIGSEDLALGVVDVLWQLVHGRRMIATSYDLTSAPRDESLLVLRQTLADDLVASQFNAMRTLSLILTDPTQGRQVPSVMLGNEMLTADETTFGNAAMAIDSFAAGLPPVDRVPRSERVAIASSEVRDRIPSLAANETVLAQSSDAITKTVRPSEGTRVDRFPRRTALVPPAWIESLPTFESRVEHMVALAGRSKASTGEWEVAQSMKALKGDSALLWQQIWWLVR